MKLPMLNPLLHKYSFPCINNTQFLKKFWEKEKLLITSKCFLLNQIIVFPFVHILDIISLFAAEFEETKTGISGKWLTTQND